MKVRLFGILSETAGTEVIEVEASSTHELLRAVRARIARSEQLSFSIAVDRKVVHHDLPLRGDEEIALLPPFAGG